jgi:hypothetical protein
LDLDFEGLKVKQIGRNTQGDVFGSGSAKHLHSQEANDKTIFFKTKWVTT